MELHEKLKDLRKKKDLTQTDLGKLMGVSKQQIHRLESGKGDHKQSTIARWKKALGIAEQ